MIICALIASAVIALVLVVLVQGKWTSRDSWFAAVFASAVMAMVIDHLRQSHQLADAQAIFRRRLHQPRRPPLQLAIAVPKAKAC